MAYIGKKPTDVPLTAGDITDGSISNSKLAQDVISAETELAVAPATTDEFLISDAGTLKRIDYSLIKSDPTHVLLETQTVTSGVSEVDFTSNINSTYKIYMFDLINLHLQNDNVNLYIRFFQGGSVDTGGVYDFGYSRTISSVGSIGIGNNGNVTEIQAMDGINANTAVSSLNGRMFLFEPSNTTFHTQLQFHLSGTRDGEAQMSTVGSGRIDETVAVDGVRFYTSSGNIDSGIIKLYGVN